MNREPPPTAHLESRLPHVAAADEAACRAMEETEIIRLSIEGQRHIAAAILNPTPATAVIKEASNRYREVFGV